MQVAFFGNGLDYSIFYLKALMEAKVDIVAVVAPDRERGTHRRRFTSQLRAKLPKSVKRSLATDMVDRFLLNLSELAEEAGAALFTPPTVNDPSLVDELALLGPDLIVMAGFNEILKAVVLDELSPIINIHPSLLPDFRGPHPEFWVLRSGAQESGVTIHIVSHGIDTGPILAQQRFALEPWLTGGDLHYRSMAVGRRLLHQLLANWAGTQTPRWPQEGEGSYFGKVLDTDLVVPFLDTGHLVHAHARAIAPWSPVHLFVERAWWDAGPRMNLTSSASRTQGRDMIRVHLRYPSLFEGYSLGTPGTLLRTEDGGLAVACADGAVAFAEARAFGES